MGIGTSTPQEKLSVNGKVRAKEVKVENDNWPDYVFDADYKRMSLTTLDQYIQKNKPLPNTPTSIEVQRNGIDLGQLGATLLQKMEEMTLHIIDLKKENDQLKIEVEKLKKH